MIVMMRLKSYIIYCRANSSLCDNQLCLDFEISLFLFIDYLSIKLLIN